VAVQRTRRLWQGGRGLRAKQEAAGEPCCYLPMCHRLLNGAEPIHWNLLEKFIFLPIHPNPDLYSVGLPASDPHPGILLAPELLEIRQPRPSLRTRTMPFSILRLFPCSGMRMVIPFRHQSSSPAVIPVLPFIANPNNRPFISSALCRHLVPSPLTSNISPKPPMICDARCRLPCVTRTVIGPYLCLLFIVPRRR
jgi:hypothetical protein